MAGSVKILREMLAFHERGDDRNFFFTHRWGYANRCESFSMITFRNPHLILTAAVCCVFMVGLVTGMAGEKPVVATCGNDSPALADQYTMPFGGFNKTLFSSAPQDSSFETGYTFYSRNYGPGEVTINASISGNASVTIDPSTFTVEPNHTYVSRVLIRTGAGFDTKSIALKVTLANNSRHFGDDNMDIYMITAPGLIWVNQDMLMLETNEIVLKKGECQQYNLTYHRGLAAGLGTINYSLSETPLNVTIIPSQFNAKQGVGSPSRILFFAPSSLSTGDYTVNLTVNGASQWLYLNNESGWSYPTQYDGQEKMISFSLSVE